MSTPSSEPKRKRVPKPDWLKTRLGASEIFAHTKQSIEHRGLNTICHSGRCPNQGECWSAGVATFMIGGAYCTRACRFCNTQTMRTPPPLDPSEPQSVADSIREMGLRHAVITSVDRDDLSDYGLAHWVSTVKAIQQTTPEVSLELLIPDFNGDLSLVDRIIELRPKVISHNLETVKRLTPSVRHRATYEQSMNVLSHIARQGIRTKTGIMVGLGETPEEVKELMQEVHQAGVSVLTIGQYLQPTRKHLEVVEYIHPRQFSLYSIWGHELGIDKVESGPLVRSSYHAERHI